MKNVWRIAAVFLPVLALIIFLFWGNTVDLNYDLGKQIKMGEVIFTTGQIPKTNLFSYTHPDYPNVEVEWLTELIFYLVTKAGGVAALSLLAVIVFSLTFFIPIFSSVKQNKNLLAIFAVALLQIGILLQRVYIRPEMFSFLFLVIYIFLLTNFRRRFSYWICLLPLLQILWVNIHLYYIVGWGVIGVYAFEEFISKKGKTPLLVFLAATLANLVNPNGLTGALLPFYVFSNYAPVVTENVNIFKTQFAAGAQTVTLISDYFFEISLFVLFLGLFMRKSRQWADWLLVAGFGAIGILAVRTVPLLLFANFALLVETAKQRVMILGFIVIAFLLIIFSWQDYKSVYLSAAVYGNGPAVGFIIKNNLKGPIFNNYDTGEYLDYRLYPKEQVFIDQRPEAYPPGFMEEYIKIQNFKEEFAKAVDKYRFNLVFFTHTDTNLPATNFLKDMFANPDWAPVYLDDWTVIFLKHGGKKITRENLQIANTSFSDNNKIAAARLALLFTRLEWWDEAVKYYKKILALDPNECFAMQNMAVIYYQSKSPEANYYWTMFNAKNCKPQ